MNTNQIQYLRNLDANIQKAFNIAIELRDPSQYGLLKNDLTAVLQNLKGFQAIHFYGSRMSGLASESSDIDVFVQIDNNYHKPKLTHAQMSRYVIDTVKLYKYSNKFDVIAEYSQAFVPICTLLYKPRGERLTLDHSYLDGLGVENNKIINHWMSMHNEEARKLALFMRNWFDMSQMKDYKFHKTLDNLTIFFLEESGYLPSFKEMNDRTSVPIMIDGVNVAYHKQMRALDYGKKVLASYKSQIKEFFKFYASFDFQNYFVCTYAGIRIRKNEMLRHSKMQVHLNAMNYIYNNHGNDPMIVLGFLDMSRNFAAEIDFQGLTIFRSICQNSMYINV